jgi:molecular chaperone HscB
MNAFTLLGFEPTLDLDDAELKSRFELLRTQFHPDRFSHGSALERRLAVQRAADINAAYATLANPLSRAQFYFELHGIKLDEARCMDDAAFLMQQMELREALEEVHDLQARQKLRQQVQQLWSQSWQALYCTYSTENQADAPSIQRELQRLQFLQRFLEQME